jgi:hypothetical protein
LRTIHWDLSTLPVFEKNFYIEHPDVKRRSEQIADEWRRHNEITVVGRGIPKPVFNFEEASMPEYVLREVLKQGFKAPSPIQSQGWPMALLGRDMIGISATGSGKTLAFLLPAMIHINAQVPWLWPSTLTSTLSYTLFVSIFHIYPLSSNILCAIFCFRPKQFISLQHAHIEYHSGPEAP